MAENPSEKAINPFSFPQIDIHPLFDLEIYLFRIDFAI